jgi:hypothetical protein
MPTLKIHPFQHHPIRLTREQQKHPLQVFAEFFDASSLGNLREDLRRWYEAAVSSDCEVYTSGVDRSNLFFLYNQIEVLIEAAFVLHQKAGGEKFSSEKEKRRRRKRRNRNKVSHAGDLHFAVV